MKKSVLALSLFFLLFSQNLLGQKEITLEDIWTKGSFSTKGVAGFSSLKDGRFFCKLDGQRNLLKFEYASGRLVDTLVRNQDLKAANNGEAFDFGSFDWSEDETKLVFATESESIYRHSSKSVFYVYDIKSKNLSKPVSDKVRYGILSPDNSKMAFVRNNDLYYYDFIAKAEVRVTKDGKENSIINGATDWVYEEEFAIWVGFSWSPNSDKLAFYRFDETKVPEYEMAIYGSLYPSQEKFKYPKAGEVNSVVNIFVFDTKSELIAEMQTGTETDMYLPRMKWTQNNEVLSIQRLNRLQNKLELLLADAKTGSTKVIYTETNSYYIDITDNLTFLMDGKSFLISAN